jgi:hypothetical protein
MNGATSGARRDGEGRPAAGPGRLTDADRPESRKFIDQVG